MKRHDFKKVIRKLELAFQLTPDPTDHDSYDIYKGGIYITMIKNSFSAKDWQDKLIARNLHISTTDLHKFKECTFSNEELIEKIKNKGYWPSAS